MISSNKMAKHALNGEEKKIWIEFLPALELTNPKLKDRETQSYLLGIIWRLKWWICKHDNLYAVLYWSPLI